MQTVHLNPFSDVSFNQQAKDRQILYLFALMDVREVAKIGMLYMPIKRTIEARMRDRVLSHLVRKFTKRP